MQVQQHIRGCFMTTLLAPSNESISATAILIIVGAESAGSIISRQWISSNYGSARSCAGTMDLEKRNVRLPIPDNPEGFGEIMALPWHTEISLNEYLPFIYQRETNGTAATIISFNPTGIKPRYTRGRLYLR